MEHAGFEGSPASKSPSSNPAKKPQSVSLLLPLNYPLPATYQPRIVELLPILKIRVPVFDDPYLAAVIAALKDSEPDQGARRQAVSKGQGPSL